MNTATAHQDRCESGRCEADTYVQDWNEAEAIVARQWPEAKHVGMGHWKIARRANIFYTGNPEHPERGVARLAYKPMGRHA
jgi:hypothetical protein